MALPRTWSTVTLDNVAQWGSGGTPSRSNPHFYEGNIPWIKTGELGQKYIRSTAEHISEEAVRKSSAKIFPVGSVGIAMYGATIGKLSIFGIDASTNQACAVAQPYKQVLNNEYLYYFLLSEKRGLIDAGKGGAQPNISQSILKDWSISLPPIHEQNRIVAKIESLFSELDKGIESFKTAREQLKIYRQALLKHAFSGKLTAQWRAENQDKLETAEALLQRIQTEREQRYQQQLKDWENKSPSIPLLQRGKQVPASSQVTTHHDAIPPFEKGGLGGIFKPKAPKTLPPLTAEELAELPELPQGWDWVKLSAISTSIQIGPFGSLLHKEDYVSNAIPLVNPSHIKNLKIVPDWDLTVNEQKLKELSNYILKANDIIIGRRGEMGRCAVIRNSESGWLCGTGSLFVRLLPSLNADFYCHILSSKRVREYLSSSSIGTTMQNLNQEILHRVPVPLCSGLEQEEIFGQIERQFSITDQLDQTLTTALQQAEALRQSILKKAFSGQLVPQDPSDEPASVLLERIQAEKAALIAPIKGKKKNATVDKVEDKSDYLHIRESNSKKLIIQEKL